MPPINAGDTAWLLASSALVLLMTPGLALFYGGMVRTKSVLNMLMMNFATIAVVSVLWVFYGFAVSFSTDVYHGVLGGSDYWGLRGAFSGLKSLWVPFLADGKTPNPDTVPVLKLLKSLADRPSARELTVEKPESRLSLRSNGR